MAFKYCVKTSLSPDSRAATRKLNASLVLLLISSNFMIFPFCRLRLFVSSLHARAEQTGEDGEREKTTPAEGGRVRGAARCVPNAFTVLLLFGATPAHEPERLPEPWPKGVHPIEAEWKRREAT